MDINQVDFINVVRDVWDQYDLDNIDSINQIEKGFKNKTFKLSDDKGQLYIVKIFNKKDHKKEKIEVSSHVIHDLSKSLNTIVDVIENKQDKLITDNGDFLATVNYYASCVDIAQERVSLNAIKNTYKSLSELHDQLEKIDYFPNSKRIDVDKILDLSKDDATYKEIKNYFDKSKINSKSYQDFIDKYNYEIAWVKKHKNLLEAQEYILNHGDYSWYNLCVVDDKIENIFDFDELVFAPREYDIALSIFYFDLKERITSEKKLVETAADEYFSGNQNQEIYKRIIFLIRYYSIYRIARYFTYYQYQEFGWHYSVYESILNRYSNIEF